MSEIATFRCVDGTERTLERDECIPMPIITTELASLLSTVSRPGDYFTSGTAEIMTPRLEVDGVGIVALPLLPVQAEQLVAAAERAPYGRGADTIVDTEVRRTWQIGADRVRIAGKHWAAALEGILGRVAEGLGVSEPIVAELYKLLVYDQGSFFLGHRDTEKLPGMFATLVIVLPSVATGGELLVRHKGREARLDLHPEDPSEVAFAAFYADCVHEVLPVTSGCRLTLVYNLLRQKRGERLEPPSYEREQARVAALLQAWAAGEGPEAGAAPRKIIYLLEHAYTEAELGFRALKGADAAAAAVLAGAAEQSDCDLHLAMLSIQESGAADYVADYGSRRRWRAEEDEFEAGDVAERHVSLSEWRLPDGSAPALDELPVSDEELSPPDALEALEPDEVEFEEATGNAGASFERTYRHAALVLWPRREFLRVLSQAGLGTTLPYLTDLTNRWAAADAGHRVQLWNEAHELAGHMISDWPKGGWYARQGGTDAARLLTLLTRLQDTKRIDAFLAGVLSRGLHVEADNDAIVGALGQLSPGRGAALIERLVAGTAATSPAICASLLARAVGGMPTKRRAGLIGAAGTLVNAIPGDPARAAAVQPWQSRRDVEAGLVVDLFTALVSIDEALAGTAAAYVLAWPKTYKPDAVLVPAVCTLFGLADLKASSAVRRLRDACVAHLSARAGETLEAPKDWRRPATISCSCRNCGEVNRFLGSPERQTWLLRAAEADRAHVEENIKDAQCDLDMMTDRRGRPYTLVCTKNQASYERQLKQRQQDLADLKRLEA
jgi:hypothetical protein